MSTASVANRAQGSWPLVAATALGVTVAVAVTTVNGWVLPSLAIAFIAFIAIGEVSRVELPGERTAAPFATAAAIAYAMLPAFGGVELGYGVSQVVSVVTAGMLIGAVPRAMSGYPLGVEDVARRVVSIAVLAAIFRPLLGTNLFDPQHPEWRLAVVMSGAALVAGAVDVAIGGLLRASHTHAPVVRSIIDEGRAVLAIGLATTATGVLIALAAPLMGYWALPVFSLPLMLTQFSFRRFATIRTTYSQTILALSRVTEVSGQTETGHPRRVARLALMVGREMGVPERDLVDLEYAALMHDIGLLSAGEMTPPGGATTMSTVSDQRTVAGIGSHVISETGVLDRVAEIVGRQADPYRPDGSVDEALPVESRIIKVVNAYDDLVGASMESDRKQRAVQRLALATARDYDPAVVDTLTRIVDRQIAAEWGGRF